jgi:hypothetical protein
MLNFIFVAVAQIIVVALIVVVVVSFAGARL